MTHSAQALPAIDLTAMTTVLSCAPLLSGRPGDEPYPRPRPGPTPLTPSTPSAGRNARSISYGWMNTPPSAQ